MDSQWLKLQLKNHPEKTKAKLAAAIGLEPPAISKILNGTRQIKAQEYGLMRQFFGLPADGHNAVKKSRGTAPPNNGVTDGLKDSPRSMAEWMLPAGTLSGVAAKAPSEKRRVFEVREKLMEPDFQQGDHVLADITDRKPSPPGVFIVSDGFTNMLRHCELLSEKECGEVKISANSPDFQTQILKAEDFFIIGRVIGKVQMF